jgi:hypothetical protein
VRPVPAQGRRGGPKRESDLSVSRRGRKQAKLEDDDDGAQDLHDIARLEQGQIVTVRGCHLCHGPESDLAVVHRLGSICFGQKLVSGEHESMRLARQSPEKQPMSPRM